MHAFMELGFLVLAWALFQFVPASSDRSSLQKLLGCSLAARLTISPPMVPEAQEIIRRSNYQNGSRSACGRISVYGKDGPGWGIDVLAGRDLFGPRADRTLDTTITIEVRQTRIRDRRKTKDAWDASGAGTARNRSDEPYPQ